MGIEDKKSKILINAQHWLGRCYLEQAMKAKGKDSEQLFVQAVEHFHQQLLLAKQLVDEQKQLSRTKPCPTLVRLLLLTQAMKVRGKDSEQLFGQAIRAFSTTIGICLPVYKQAKQYSTKNQCLTLAWSLLFRAGEESQRQGFETVI